MEILSRDLDARGNRVINYANCGNPQKNSLPNIAVNLPWRAGKQSSRIQSAIDNLRSGQYLKLDNGMWELDKPLVLSKSNTGLRGKRTTKLKALWTNEDAAINIAGYAAWLPSNEINVKITSNVTVGSRVLVLEDAGGFSVGDHVIIKRYTNWRYIDELNCREFGWTPSAYTFKMDRVILEITGNSITVDDDIVVEISSDYGGGSVYKYNDARITNLFISDLSISSVFTGNLDENHAKQGINIRNAKYISIWNVNAEVVQTIVISDYSVRYLHVYDCSHKNPKSTITGGRRYSFYMNGVNCLVENCSAADSRHSFVASSRVMGPNVFYKCKASNEKGDSGPHHRHSAGFLYDNVDAVIHVQHRGSSGNDPKYGAHGVAGVWHTLWNTGLNKKVLIQSFGSTALNLGVGISSLDSTPMYPQGGQLFIKAHSRGEWVIPESLFKYQRSVSI